MQKGRIAWTLVAALASEAVNKIVPLLTLHLAATRLGVEAFGSSQFALWILEWGILLVAFGYAQSIPLALRRAQSAVEKQEIAGAVLAGRMFQAGITLIATLVLLAAIPGWDAYRPAIIASSFILFTSALEMSGVLLALQKNALVSLSMVAGKLASLAGIWWLVQSPADSVAFVTITNGANAIVGTGTFLISLKLLGVRIPRRGQIWQMFTQAAPFAGATLLLVALERFDLAIVEHFQGSQGAGLYSASSRLVQSITPLIAAISTVFFSEMIAIFDVQEIRRHMRLSVLSTMAILLPVTAGAWFAGGGVLELVFGNGFGSQAPTLSVLLLVCVAHSLILVAGFQMCGLRQKMRPLFFALACGLAAAIVTGIPATARWGLTGAAWASVAGRWIAAIMVTHATIRDLGIPARDFIGPLLKTAIPTMGMAAILYAWQKATGAGTSGDIGRLGPFILTGAITYAAFFMLFNRREARAMLAQVTRRRQNQE